jgi:hypothetical protein
MTNQQHGTTKQTSFARSSIGGKKTSEVKARTSDELKFELQRRCHEIGVTESEYVERLLALSLFGEEHVNSLEVAKTRAVAGKCPPGGALGVDRG